jgi:hypothetical protein
MKYAILAGMLLGLLLLLVCFVLAGVGEGALWPTYLFFGPVLLAMEPVYEWLPSPESVVPLLVFLAVTPLLYAIYALLLRLGRRWGIGGPTLLVVLGLHYTGAVIAGYREQDTTVRLWDKFQTRPILFLSVAVLLVALHAIGIVYAMKGPRVAAPASEPAEARLPEDE